jgi:hypothetical protein
MPGSGAGFEQAASSMNAAQSVMQFQWVRFSIVSSTGKFGGVTLPSCSDKRYRLGSSRVAFDRGKADLLA